MKYRTSFVTNSSSSSFLITNKTSNRLSSEEIAKKLAYKYTELRQDRENWYIEAVREAEPEELGEKVQELIDFLEETNYQKYLKDADFTLNTLNGFASQEIECGDNFRDNMFEAAVHDLYSWDGEYENFGTIEVTFLESHH